MHGFGEKPRSSRPIGESGAAEPMRMAMAETETEKIRQAARYWWAKLWILLGILAIWATVSFGCGILFRDWLDEHMIRVGNAPFGFWMAQQGSILCFVLLLLLYRFLMNRLDDRYGYNEEGDPS